MAEYTTVVLVKKRVENIDASLVDADIGAHIEEAEQILNAIMGASFLTGDTPGGFDVTKHGILRAACNAYAAMVAIDFNPAGFTSLAEAVSIRGSLWDQWQDLLERLKDKSIVAYLESLTAA